MSAEPDTPLVGDLIEIEHTSDFSATAPTWNVVGHTTDTIEPSPNVETAEIRQHGEFMMDQNAVSEAWETTFSKKITSGPGALDILGLIGDNFELYGYHDTREAAAAGNAPNEALRVTVYANVEARASGTVKYQLGFTDYILSRGDGEIAVEDFSTLELTIFSRSRPIRIDLGGVLGGGGGGGGV